MIKAEVIILAGGLATRLGGLTKKKPKSLLIIEKDSILEFLASKVAKWWLPDEIVFMKELPHGATGKLQKFELREEYNNHYMDK